MLWNTIWRFFRSESGVVSPRAGLSFGWLVVMVVAISILVGPQPAMAACNEPCGNCYFVKSCPPSPCAVYARDCIGGCREYWYCCSGQQCPNCSPSGGECP